MKIVENLASTLCFAANYRLFSRMVGGANSAATYLSEYVSPKPGEKVLDIGCGPADMLNYLRGVDYTGLDISQEYIEAAKKRFGNRGRFWCGDVGLASIEEEKGIFDLVLATGVVHHLDDQRAASLFDLAHLALRPGGRLVTLDGCYVAGQSGIARWLLNHDRGKFIRTQAEYERLASGRFSRVESWLRRDLLRIPYTHLIVRCCK